MKKLFSKLWNSSTQRRKQRKYNHNAPLHIRHKMMSSPLSKELRKEWGTRNVPIRKGDTVKIISGQFKDKSGKVTEVSLAKMKILVDGVTVKRGDSTDANYPLHASNVMITKLDLTDKKRQEKLEKLKKKDSKKVEAKK